MSSATPKCMIYVVDDDLDVLGSLQFLLEAEDFDVRTFRSGTSLLTSNLQQADCFVIDYEMPQLNGIELVHKLHGLGIETPVVLITGYPDERILTNATTAGVSFLLYKPHLENSLGAHIRLAIELNG